jgi:hypothetical protein
MGVEGLNPALQGIVFNELHAGKAVGLPLRAVTPQIAMLSPNFKNVTVQAII